MSTWQDMVIGTGQIMFALALLPSILGDEKPDRWTCFLTALVLYIFTATYLSLGMVTAAASSALCALGWTVLLLQRRVLV